MAKIAVLSDIHYGKFSRSKEFSVPGEPIQDRNSGAVSIEDSFIKVLKQHNVEYLFVAGDLTSVGSPQEFHYCEEKILSIAKRANILEENVIVGLGNHDIDWSITKIYDQYLESKKDDFPIDLVRENYQLIAANTSNHSMKKFVRPTSDLVGPAPFSGIIEKDNFVVFLLNSGWKCSHDQTLPNGKLSNSQLEWFEKSVEKYKFSNKWKVVLMHHHPYSYPFHIQGPDISMLEEGGKLQDIAGIAGVNLIVHGHRHHPKAETVHKNHWMNPITFLCAGSFSVNSKERSDGDIPNTVHILELEENPNELTLYNYQYSSAEGWIPIKNNCPTTPVDSKMKLGKIFDINRIEESILDLIKYDKEIKWDSIDDSLKFMKIEDLNAKMKEILSETHTIVGRFPNDVCLIMK